MKLVQSLGMSLLVTGLWSTTAMAQVAEKADNVASADVGIADIIVTANRRSENLQKVPISIAAFDSKTLTRLGIQSSVDLPQVTPGLVQNRAIVGVNAFLRGVGQSTGGYTSEVPVATYLDGLYLPNSASSAFSFNNIERIEVLKGPQGTLYGRNTTGGLIHVITKDPGSKPSVDVSASYGNYNTTQLNFYGSTPLSETLGANIAVTYTNQMDGWGYNAFTGREAYTFKDFGVQGKLKWMAGDDTTVTLQAFYDRINSDQGLNGQIVPGSIGADGTTYQGEYVTNLRRTPFAKQTQKIVSLKVEQGFDFAKLTSITGYIYNTSPAFFVQSYNVGNTVAGQNATFFGLDEKAKTFSQELQLASSNDSALSWLVGAFYYHDKTNIKGSVSGYCSGTTAATCTGSPTPRFTDGTQKTESISGYVDGTYSITPTTRLTLGVRYTSDKKSVSGYSIPLAGLPNTPASLPAPVYPGQPFGAFPNGIPTEITAKKLTYRAVIAQDLSEDVNIYASYNRGFKSGGFSIITFNNLPTKPEVLDSFEVGFKSRTSDRVLQVNASGFYYIYKDIQLRTTAPPAVPGTTILYNAAKAHIKGIDLDAVIAPLPGLSFTLAGELLDAKYADFPGGTLSFPRPNGGFGYTTTGNNQLRGYTLPQAPKFSYTIGVNYALDTSVGRFDFAASDGYKSHYYFEPNNRLGQKGFHLLNASLTWTPENSGFSLQAYGRNLTGYYYYTGGGDGSGGNDFGIPGAPRTYGVKARYQF